MHLESGPAAGERNWQLLILVFFVGFGLYFLYDWKIGWPNANHKAALKKMPQKFEDPSLAEEEAERIWAELGETPTRADLQTLDTADVTSLRAIEERLGAPTRTGNGKAYFASRFGVLTVEANGDRVRDKGWEKWARDRDEIEGQLYWSFLPFALALFPLRNLIQAVRLRVVLDDDGMNYAGERIPYSAIRSVRDYNKKGWVDVYYEKDGVEKKQRLDNQKVARFDEIVAAICEVKEFENPILAGQAADSDDHDRDADGDAT